MKIVFPDPEKIRPPETEWERWLAHGLLTLAELDADRATVRNGVGFNRDDSTSGKRWADMLYDRGGLNDAGWTWCRRKLPKYRGQFGGPPR